MSIGEYLSDNYPEFLWAISLASIVAYFAYRNNVKSRHADASIKFRSTVLEILSGLYPVPTNWPKNSTNIDYVLRNAFPKLQAAVAEFRPHVPWYRRKAFDDCWFRYRCSTGREIDQQCYHHYMAFDDQPDPKDTFRKNVDKLLSFAK